MNTGLYYYGMIRNQEPLKNRLQTARRIKHLIEQYYTDLRLAFVQDGNRLLPLADLTLDQYFNFVKNIPYRKDKQPFEIVARPYYIIKHRALGMDCKKKAVAVGAYLRMKNFKYRAIGSSNRPDKKIHHIYMQLFDPKKKEWKNVDATYNFYKLFEPKTAETYREVLK